MSRYKIQTRSILIRVTSDLANALDQISANAMKSREQSIREALFKFAYDNGHGLVTLADLQGNRARRSQAQDRRRRKGV